MRALKQKLKSAAPKLYGRASYEWNFLRLIRDMHGRYLDFAALRSIAHHAGGTSHSECPVCDFVGFFKAFGNPPRWNAICPSCGSLERHRLLALALKKTPILHASATVLHFAPEACLEPIIRKSVAKYITADIQGGEVDMTLNIESIDLPENFCDLIFCSHVLEHVANDRGALVELKRILKPGGTLVLMVPILDGEVTYEDPTITSAHDRELHYGHPEHLRHYGRDFHQRISNAGFQYQVDTAWGADVPKFGLLWGDRVFLCNKAARP